jgi:hypothetical protein
MRAQGLIPEVMTLLNKRDLQVDATIRRYGSPSVRAAILKTVDDAFGYFSHGMVRSDSPRKHQGVGAISPLAEPCRARAPAV